jgi:adenine-specific DNA-methyltransferase
MMTRQQKLELTWFNKNVEFEVEPRTFVEDVHKSNIEFDVNTKNMLIHGDNLLALKALEQKFLGRIKCIYIDPPYNIATATPHYDDNLENSLWLNLMRPRLKILWGLLTPDGLLAVQIDDEQFARLFLLMEEICTQKNMKTICVKMSEPTGVKMASIKKARSIPKLKEFIILAKKDGIKNLNMEYIPKEKWDNEYKILINGISREELDILKQIMENDDSSEETINLMDNIASKISISSINEITKGVTKKEEIENIKYENSWRIARDVAVTGNVKELADQKRLLATGESFVVVTPQKKKYLMKKDYNVESAQPRCKLLFADQYLTIHPGDLWTDIKTTGLDNEGIVDFPKSKKPEKLVKRIIQLNTNEGDFVLDSFLGSGTTAAVAHKMKRKWIGIELGDHAYTHCKVRLDKVIAGEQGGISKAVNWTGGGGYKFFELAPSLIKVDSFGQEVINSEYNPEMLAMTLSIHEGYIYEPDKELYWKQSKSSDNSFLFVTTSHVSKELVESIYQTMADEEYLLIVCKSYDASLKNSFKNIKYKKIPQSILKNCEFGVENYNLNIIETDYFNEERENE